MQNLIRPALIFVTLFLHISGQAVALEDLEHATLQLDELQFDLLGGLAESVVSVKVYEHEPEVAPTSEPVARLQRTASGTTEQRKMGTSPVDTNSATLVRHYDTDGLIVQEYTVDSHGDTQQRKAFLYDEDGRIQQVTSYQGHDAVESAHIFLYAENLLGEVAVYEADGRPRWRRVYEYPNEHVVRWSLLHADGRLQQAGELIYGAEKVLQEHRSLDENNTLTERRTFEYDNRGNLIRRVIEDGNGEPVSVTRYRYTYDERGTWTRVDAFVVETRRERPFQVVRNAFTREVNYDSSNERELF